MSTLLILHSHTKAECTQPRVFKGECRICKQVGHPAADCTEKPPVKCFNCKEEGHEAKDCKSNRVFDQSGVEDCTADEAWTKLKNADESEDLDDIRTVSMIYDMKDYIDLTLVSRLSKFTAEPLQWQTMKSSNKPSAQITSIPFS